MIKRKDKRFNSSKYLGIWITIAVIIGFIVYLIFDRVQVSKNRERNKLECNTALNREISGVVSKAFYDGSMNVKAFVIYLTNGKKYVNPIFQTSLNGYVDEGDSIYKASGTFKFIIYKHRYENPIIIIEDTIDCNKLWLWE